MIIRRGAVAKTYLLAVALCALLSACGGEVIYPTTVAQPTATAVPAAAPTDTPMSPASTDQLVALTRADLSKNLSIPADQITLVNVEEKEWSDTSLGCPKRGISYLQVITPGLIIRHAAAGVTYEYHTDLRNNFVLCTGPGRSE